MINQAQNFSLGNLLVSTSGADSLKFLSDKVGQTLEGRVIEVLTKPSQSGLSGQARTTTATNNQASTGTNAASQNSNNGVQYQVKLQVGNEKVVFVSSTAPRRGQQLRVEVVASNQLKLLAAIQTNTTAKPPLSNAGEQPSQGRMTAFASAQGSTVGNGKTNATANISVSGLNRANAELALNPSQTRNDAPANQNNNQALQSALLKSLTGLLQNHLSKNQQSTNIAQSLATVLSQTSSSNSISHSVNQLSSPQNTTHQATNAGIKNVATTTSKASLQGNQALNTALTSEVKFQAQNTQQSNGIQRLLDNLIQSTRSNNPRSSQLDTPIKTRQLNSSLPASVASPQSSVQRNNTQVANTIIHLSTLLKASLSQLQQSIPNAQTLTTTEGIKEAIQNSGYSYEQKIHTLAKLNKAVANHQQMGTVTSKASNYNHSKLTVPLNDPTLNQSRELAINVSKKTNGFENNARLDKVEIPVQNSVKQLLTNDIKYNLLNSAQLSKQLLNVLLSTQQSSIPSNMIQEFIDASLAESVRTELANNIGSTQRSDPSSSDGLMQLLKQLLSTAARQQTNGLSNVGAQLLAGNDGQQNPVNFYAELPMFFGQKLDQVDLHIDRYSSKKNNGTEKDAWHVKLRFDMEALGELTALATLNNKKISATFWASNESLANEINEKLTSFNSNLKRLGIDVASLTTHVGEMPVENNISLSELLDRHIVDTQS